MRSMIVDFSTILHSVYHALKTDKTISTEEEFIGLYNHTIINSLLQKKSIIKPDEIILCLDSKGSWRHDVFKYYKAKRKVKQQENIVDYQFLFKISNDLVNDIKEYLHWKVIQVDKAEGDDSCAILAQTLKHDVVIVSNDKDLKAMTQYENVQYFNYKKEEFEELDIDPKEYLIRLVLQGDTTDGIPNVRNDDDMCISEKRQLPLGPKTIDKILVEGLDEYLDKNNLRRNFERNRQLIDLSLNIIPEEIQKKVVDKYNSYVNINPDYMKIVQFLRKNKMKSLSQRINEFF